MRVWKHAVHCRVLQVVAGSNFFFKIQTAPTGCIHARVYRDLSNQLSVHSVQTNKQIGDPLVHF
jgi:hypothetical protein